MPRTPASPADEQLISRAALHGAVVTHRQLERWRAAGLLAPNVRRPLGRGRGSTSQPPPGADELVTWLAAHVRPGRRPGDLALLAFSDGLAVPETTVRDAFIGAIAGVQVPGEADVPPGAAPDDVVDAAVAAGRLFTLVPARVKRIDRNLARQGLDWSPPAFAQLDPGQHDPRLAGSDWVHIAVETTLTGGKGIDMGTIGSLARSLLPAGAAAPLVGQIEYRWPISRGTEPSGLPDEDDVLGALLAGGDLRAQARDLAMGTPMAELQDALRLAAALPRWADDTCIAAEREIAAATLGDGAKEWVMNSFGLGRLFLIMALKDQYSGPSGLAITALVLTFMRRKLSGLRQLLPAENFDVLNSPLIAPSFLVSFLTS